MGEVRALATTGALTLATPLMRTPRRRILEPREGGGGLGWGGLGGAGDPGPFPGAAVRVPRAKTEPHARSVGDGEVGAFGPA